MLQEGNLYLCLAVLPLNDENLEVLPVRSSTNLSTAAAV